MVIVPEAGDPFGKQDPAYDLLWHTLGGAERMGKIPRRFRYISLVNG